MTLREIEKDEDGDEDKQLARPLQAISSYTKPWKIVPGVPFPQRLRLFLTLG